MRTRRSGVHHGLRALLPAGLLLLCVSTAATAQGPAQYQAGAAPQGWQAAPHGYWAIIPPWDAGEDTLVSVEVCAGERVELPLPGEVQGFTAAQARAGSIEAGARATLVRSGGGLALSVTGPAPGSYSLRLGEPVILGLQVVVRIVDCDRRHPADYSREADDPFPLVPRPGEQGYEAWLEEVAASLPGWDEMARSLEEDLKKPQPTDDTSAAEAMLDTYRALVETERELLRLQERQGGAGESDRETAAPGDGGRPPGLLPVGWYQASEGGDAAESGWASIFDRFREPRDARYRPVPFKPPFPGFQKGGAGEYQVLPRGARGNIGDTLIIVHVCVGDTATVPLEGSIDDEDLLPATPSMEGVGGSLERQGGRLVLSLTPAEAGVYTGHLENADGGLVTGLRLEIHARDCGKPAKPIRPEDLAGRAEGAPSAESGDDKDQARPGSLGAAAGQAPEPQAEPSADEAKDEGAADGVAKGAGAAGRKIAGQGAGEGLAAGLRRGLRAAVWPVDSGALAAMRAGLARMGHLRQQAIALEAWSDTMRGKLPPSAQVVSFTTVDEESDEPDIGGTTRIDLAALGIDAEQRAEVVVNFIAQDQGLRTAAETACEVSTADNGDLVVEVPDGERLGGILVQAGGALVALIADTPRRAPLPVAAATRPVAVADGSLEVAQGRVGETVGGPGAISDPAAPVSDHGVSLGGQPLTPVAVRDGEVAIDGSGITVPADGRMDLVVTAPSGETFDGVAVAWSWDVSVPEVTERGAAVDVTLELNGVAADEAVTVTFYPQPGQEISPRNVTLSGLESGRAQPVARLTTDRLGPQGFGVEAERAATLEAPGDDG